MTYVNMIYDPVLQAGGPVFNKTGCADLLQLAQQFIQIL